MLIYFFLFTENITYTEDNVPVRCLYVGNIKLHVTKDDLEKYFKGLGRIEQIKLNNRVEYQYAFVTFTTYDEATRVLNKKSHFLQGGKLRVRPADTWHQPQALPVENTEDKEQAKSSSSEPSDIEMREEPPWKYDENAPSLMMLNDDCLLHILSYLNVLELIQIRGTSARIDDLIDIVCKKYEHFNFEDLAFLIPNDLTLMNARDILQYLGENMKSLIIDGSDFSISTNSNRILGSIIRFCKKLEILKCDAFHFNKPTIKKMIPVMKNLRIFSAGDSTKFNDEIASMFKEASKMEELIISGNWEITGKCLVRLSNLKTLSVNRCGNIQSKPFVQALLKNRSLQKLEIQRCDKLDNSVVECIVKDLKDIEELSLSNIYPSMSVFSKFADLPKLKKLTVEFHSFSPIDTLLEKLAAKKTLEELNLVGSGSGSGAATKTIHYISDITSLKTFSIAFNSNLADSDLKKLHDLTELTSLSIPGATNITSEGVLPLIKKCTKLTYLDVSQTKVDQTFLDQLVELLKSERFRREIFEVIVHDTGIEESNVEMPKFLKDNANLLTLSFVPKILNTFQFMFDDDDFDSDDDDDFIDLDEDMDDDDYGKLSDLKEKVQNSKNGAF